MANRALADVLALDQAIRDLHDDVVTDLGGFKTNANAIEDLVDNGDTVPENAKLSAWLEEFRLRCNAVYDHFEALNEPLSIVHARYASAESFDDVEKNWARFQDKLVTDADEFESRGFTKFTAWSAGGSNVGTGTAMIYNIDPAQGGDIGRDETLTARCSKSYPDTNLGREVFVITGEAKGDWSHEEGGSGDNETYGRTYGIGTNDLGPAVQSKGYFKNVGEEIESVGTEASDGNLVNDGGFENATLSDNWTVSSGSAAINSSTPINGDQDLSFPGNSVVYQSVAGKVFPGVIYGLEAWYKKVGTISAGTFTLKLKDGTTDHITISLTLSSAATSNTKLAYGTVLLPATAVTGSMQVEAAVASYSGSGTLQIDEIKLVPLYVVGGGRAVAFTGGLVPFKAQNDVFTGDTTGGTGGTLMRMLNRITKRGFESDTAATNWTD